MATVGTLQRMTAKALSEIILAEAGSSEPSYAIIDVRDDGGHIKTSQHVPSGSLDALLPTLRRTLASKRTVVFHCALSQQRGPSAALRYLRDLEAAGAASAGQAVYVLDLGFVGWAAEFGGDERLTENFRKELWEGY